jgi:PAS domain S-box-containing protein
VIEHPIAPRRSPAIGWSTAQFEAILRSVADGISVQDTSGRLVYANAPALRLLGFATLVELLDASVEEIIGRFELADENNAPLSLGDLPGRQILRGEPAAPVTVRFRVRATGAERWSIVQSNPLTGDDGRLAYVVNTFHDITDRVLAERENRMQAHLLDEVRASVIATTPTGEITHWNRHAEEIFGWPAASVRGQNIADLLVGDADRASADDLIARVRDGDRWEGEFDVRSRDGRTVPLFVTLAPAHVSDGSGGVVGVAVDISERRRAEAEVRAGIERGERQQQRQAFLADASRLLSESLDENVTVASLARLAVPTIADWCVIDLLQPDGTLAAVGVAHQEQRRVELARELRERYPPDPADSRGAYGVVRSGKSVVVNEIPAAAFDAVPDEIRQVILDLQLHAYMSVPLVAHGRAFGAITLVSAESGREFGADDLALAEDLAGRAAAAVENARLYRDVTRAQERLQRLAEAEHARAAELQAVIGAMGEAVLVVSPDGRVTLANPAVDALFPGASIDTYGALLDLLDAHDRAPRIGEQGAAAEFRVRGTDDQWVAVSTWPVRADALPEGAAGSTIVLVRDVSAARQRQAIRDTFLGVLSHELRTPITTIYAGAKVLARPSSLSEASRADLFRDIHDEAERLHRLVEDVIALNRFGETDGEIGREPVLLQRILPGVVAAEEVRWPGARFALHLSPGLPTVVSDRTYVEQVMRNLLSNAAKYGGPGVAVDVVAEWDTDEVRVRVLDDGPGFPSGEADRLFELFFRSPATSGNVGGAGIGLFVSARLIRAMGGRMWAAVRPEGGAEFGFALKVMQDD